MVVHIYTSDLSGSSSEVRDLFTDGHLSTGKGAQSASLRLKATCCWSLGSSDWSLNRVRLL